MTPARGKPAAPRRVFADYLEQARTQLADGVDPTPVWCRRATGCSAGTSVKLAAALRAEPTAPAAIAAARLSSTTTNATSAGADRKERAA